MANPDECAERLKLANSVADAVRLTYQAKGDLESARTRKSPDVDKLAAALVKARKEERDAVRSLREHIDQHKCQASS